MSQMNQDTNNGSRKAHTLYITELERQAQEAQDKEPTNEAAQEVAAPKRTFRMAKDDKTVRLLIGFAGVVAVALMMLILFSDKGKPRAKKNAEASLGRPKTADIVAPTENSSVVPQGTMQPMRDDQPQPGQVNANDIENTKKARVGAGETKSAQADVPAKNLGQIPEFPASSSSGDAWAPPPYGQKDSAGTGSAPVQDKAVDGLAKPSLVFTASTEKSSQSAPTDHDIPLLDMGTGSRLAARLASVVTTAVDQPVIAIVEYSYEHDGQLIVPAGSKAVGSVHQADRSGYLQIHFDHLETPDGSSIPIDALATDTNLGPLRGKVTGTGRGKNFAVRAATGIGQMSAMLVGQPNLNGAISIPKDRQRRIKAEDILHERGMYSPLMQVYLAYLISKGARTWYEEAPLLEVAKRNINDPLAVHHIFPRELMRDKVEPDRINCMANYAILSQADNAHIGKENPQHIYDQLSGKAKNYADEQLFFMFIEKRDWLEAYDAFLAKRAEVMADRLNAFIALS